MDQAAYLILIGAGLVLAAIAAASVSGRFGAPILLVFLALGMLAGSEGPGGLVFERYDLAVLFGSIGLAVILFDGGARTSREIFRLAAAPASMLATVGVVVTAGLVGGVAMILFDFTWTEGLLLGAIVSSTDAAAVFALLGGRGLAVRPRVAATLEAESGMNDPAAVFLVLILVQVLTGDAPQGIIGWGTEILWPLIGGAAIGFAGGRAMLAAQNRLDVAPGLYSIFALAGGLAVFGLAQTLHASGFLAVYLSAVVYGNGAIREGDTVRRALDGFAWLAQLGMFLMLGLLVFPSHLWAVAPAALGVAAFLILVARPVATLISLAVTKLDLREQAFIAWTGLRGATPIFLGVLPVLAGVENANLYFSIAFAVVILSLTVQGWTAPLAARLTGVAINGDGAPAPAPPPWRSPAVLAGVAGAAVILTACLWIARATPSMGVVSVHPQTVAELEQAIVRDGPAGPALVEALPRDLRGVNDAQRRKELFLGAVAPLIEAENAAIAAERAEVEAMVEAEAQGRTLSLAEQGRRDLLARRYDTTYADLDLLLSRVDTVPTSLALAQAVLATGWGASDAAIERNALFGRRPSSAEDTAGDPAGFRTLRSSVRDYLLTLNTRPEFADFREARRQVREEGLAPDGRALASYLTAYADSGQAYTNSLIDLIGENRLDSYDEPAPQAEARAP
jgi:cell volume regulation protein A